MHEHLKSDLPAFEQYLLAEYAHIADAHFKTMDAISTFFKHYLVIVSIPISAIALILSAPLFPSAQSMTDQFSDMMTRYRPVAVPLLFAMAITGAGVLAYILNLRLDALLYARTINGIRKYFYDAGQISIVSKVQMRMLPQSPQIPSYFEMPYFFPVVLVFAILNAFWACLAWVVSGTIQTAPFTMTAATLIVSIVLHMGLYWWYANYRETQYLKSRIIGVDIDGVLNRHKGQFCQLLKKHTDKDIRPDQITAIPVRECKGLMVTQDDEIAVFNDPKYWITMPVATGAVDNLQSIRNYLKVYIFTNRPWPITLGMDDREKEQLKIAWRRAVSSFHQAEHIAPFLWDYTSPVKDITKLWLRKHGFAYDRLIVETRGVRDRFYQIHTRKHKVLCGRRRHERCEVGICLRCGLPVRSTLQSRCPRTSRQRDARRVLGRNL